MAGVPLGIEADAEMLESGAHFPAHWRGVLADPVREDEGVDPAQDRGERADVLAELVAEERYRVGRRRLTCALPHTSRCPPSTGVRQVAMARRTARWSRKSACSRR